MTTANSKEQASTFFKRIRNAMAIYIEDLMKESDDENTRLRFHINEQNALLGKRMKALNDEANALQESRKQASNLMLENSVLRVQSKAFADDKQALGDNLTKRQQEIYELREIIVDLREKVRIYKNANCKGCFSKEMITNFKEEIKRLEKELSEVREIAFGYRET
ncbi:hypothetical protein LCGC14_1894250 [marine sediment metagenome]|uniref:Uncharacterized protein n=1 Tax=marine sediment metagenome TaxID=412755 RepID=A0A0F9IWL6_9ZZZZ